MFKRILKLLFLLLSVYLIPFNAFAQGPVQPEAMQFEPVDVTDVVNLATGDFVYTIPLMNVPGPEGNYPIVLSYHSGIGPNQPATWVGLGWTLNPGAVNRTISGYPDDYNGDIVETHYEADTKKGWGISVGIGYGPIGMNMGYNSNSGFGANAIIKGGGIRTSIGLSNSDISTSINLNKGIGSIGLSAGSQGFDVNAGIDIDKISMSTSLTSYSGLNFSMGTTLESQSSGNISQVGMGVSTVSSSSNGNFQAFSINIPIPLPNMWWASIGYSQWKWSLNETYVEPSYGVLYPAPSGAKNERQKEGDVLYPSIDAYNVSAQGISGAFSPVHTYQYVLQDNFENDEKGIYSTSFDGNNFSANSAIEFRFLNDNGLNYTTDEEGFNFGTLYTNIDTEYASDKITPMINSLGKIAGFKITKKDGMVYEFNRAVTNYFQHSKSEDDGSGTSFTNSNTLHTPFATSWLLTSIKGPDYVDRGLDGSENTPNGEIDDNDWGYWIKFNYVSTEKPSVWRTPFSGYSYGLDEDVKFYSLGVREDVILQSIETATHKVIATPASEKRLDIVTPGNDLGSTVDITTKIVNQSNLTSGVELSGNFDWINNVASGTDDVVTLNYWVKLNEHYEDEWSSWNDCWDVGEYGSGTQDENGDYYLELQEDFDIPFNNLSIGTYSADENTTTLSLDNSNYDLGYRNDCISDEYWYLNVEIAQYLVQGEQLSNKLESLVLVNKLDETTPIKKVDFDFDYSLRPNWRGSAAGINDGADGGSLTLKSLEFYGQNSSLTRPPYRFEYGNGDFPGTGKNPGYDLSDLDFWGNYRYPGEDPDFSMREDHKRFPHSEKEYADYATAWNLTSIITPTGSRLEIEYESDDFYKLNGVTDISSSIYFKVDNGNTIDPNPHSLVEPNRLVIDETETPLTGEHFEKYYSVFLVEERWYEDASTGGFYQPNVTNLGNYAIIGFDDINNYVFLDQSIANLIRDRLPGDGSTDYYSYHIRAIPKVTYGGGSRVKEIRTIDGTNKNITSYTYMDGVNSSGTTSSLPFSDLKSLVNNARVNEYGFYYGPGFFDPNGISISDLADIEGELKYGGPSPGIIYSKVQVANVNSIGEMTNGYTEYEFYTPNDYPYDYEETVISAGYVEWYLENRTGIYGKPKSITYYENYLGSLSRVVNKTEFLYAFSDELPVYANIFKENNGATNSSKPLGVTQQKHISRLEQDSNDDVYTSMRVGVDHLGVYDIGKEITDYEYLNDYTSVSSGSMRIIERVVGFDAHTGMPLISVTESEVSDEFIFTNTIPAWWKYSGMYTKNMLTQVFQNTTYRTNSESSGYTIIDIDDLPGLKLYYLPEEDITNSSITTWDQWGAENVWRKSDTYIYNPKFDYSPFPDNWLLASDASYPFSQEYYPTADSGTPWEMTSNILEYDNFGHVIESVNKDGTYNSVLYDHDNHSLVLAVASNAKLDEIEYVNFETSNSSNAHTGEASYYFNGSSTPATAPSSTPVFGGNYKAYFWIKSSGEVLLQNDITLPSTNNNWELFSYTLSPGESLYLQGSANIDDITIIPEYASISYFAYDPLTWKVTAMTGPDHRTIFYEYDDAGRLILTRDFEGNIMAENEYGFSGEFYIETSPLNPTASSLITFLLKQTNDNSNASMDEYTWDFGDGSGTYSTVSNSATHTYSEPQDFTVSVTFENSTGTTRRLIQDVSVGVPIEIGFDNPQITNCIEDDDGGGPNPAIKINIPELTSALDSNETCDVSLTAFLSNAIGALTYQWSRYDTEDEEWDLISGANSNTLFLNDEPIGTLSVKLEVTDAANTSAEKTRAIIIGAL